MKNKDININRKSRSNVKLEIIQSRQTKQVSVKHNKSKNRRQSESPQNTAFRFITIRVYLDDALQLLYIVQLKLC